MMNHCPKCNKVNESKDTEPFCSMLCFTQYDAETIEIICVNCSKSSKAGLATEFCSLKCEVEYFLSYLEEYYVQNNR